MFSQELQAVSNKTGLAVMGEPCYGDYVDITDPDEIESTFSHVRSTYNSIQVIFLVLPKDEDFQQVQSKQIFNDIHCSLKYITFSMLVNVDNEHTGCYS